MPLPASVLGLTGDPVRHHVDLRWILSYSAGIGDTADSVFGPGAVAHPVFPVAPEWPAVLSVRHIGLAPGEASRGVHASHDLTIHRAVRPGDDLTTVATIVGVEEGRAGAVTWIRLVTTDANGEAVSTTFQRNVLLGVELDGEPGFVDRPAPLPPLAPATPSPLAERSTSVLIGPQEAHVYTECSRIWNPIHTEWQAVKDAGLPFMLLHGTATLAKAVSAVDDLWGGRRREIARIITRFAAPVPMPTTLSISAKSDGSFEVRLPDGSEALKDSRIIWREPNDPFSE